MIPQYVYFIAFNSSGRVTNDAANITATLAKDDANASPLTNNVATHIANGKYRFALTAAERTGSRFSFDAYSPTGDVNVLHLKDTNDNTSEIAKIIKTGEDQEWEDADGSSLEVHRVKVSRV